MIIGRVIGNVWATRKETSLNGLKLLVIQPLDSVQRPQIVAGDAVGAGIGDMVLVTTGSSARRASGSKECTIDAMVVGIVDELDAPTSEGDL